MTSRVVMISPYPQYPAPPAYGQEVYGMDNPAYDRLTDRERQCHGKEQRKTSLLLMWNATLSLTNSASIGSRNTTWPPRDMDTTIGDGTEPLVVQDREYSATASTEQPADVPESQFGSTFSEKAIRHAFIRKVYLILTLQLLITFAVVSIFTFAQPVKDYIRSPTNSTGVILYFTSFGVFIILYITLVCVRSVSRTWPGNVICLSLLTLSLSFMTGMIASYHDTQSVVMAFGITMGVCIGVTLFSIQTKYDFTTCSGVLFCLLMALFWFGCVCLIAHLCYLPMMNAVYGGLGAVVFSLFLAFDTQLVIGNKKYAITPEEYVYAAIQLYIDVIYIFLYLLGAMRK